VPTGGGLQRHSHLRTHGAKGVRRRRATHPPVSSTHRRPDRGMISHLPLTARSRADVREHRLTPGTPPARWLSVMQYSGAGQRQPLPGGSNATTLLPRPGTTGAIVDAGGGYSGRVAVAYQLLYLVGFKPWERGGVDRDLARFLDLEEQTRTPPYGRALDLGCGTGLQSRGMHRRIRTQAQRHIPERETVGATQLLHRQQTTCRGSR